MGYGEFSYWYDGLNTEADYDALAGQILARLRQHNVHSGIVADLGCGTGEITLRLAWEGYDMIAIDNSVDMLGLLREKLEVENVGEVLVLNQDLAELDLYGTIRAAVSTFDTLNHLDGDALAKALERTALFMEPGGVLVFDINTPYKQKEVLGDNTFEIESEDDPDVVCVWKNRYDPAIPAVHIHVEGRAGDEPVFYEEFLEYTHTENWIENQLAGCGFTAVTKCDGEGFGPVTPESQRILYTAVKR